MGMGPLPGLRFGGRCPAPPAGAAHRVCMFVACCIVAVGWLWPDPVHAIASRTSTCPTSKN
eukprot:345605-Prymnesium_polylepis.1